jgi:hypothetical protein
MSGGGSGSSGGSSGTIDYPAYMKTVHGLLLDGGGADTPSSSVVDCINTALATSPYTGLTAYDPDTDITAQESAITTFSALASALAYHTDYDIMAAAGKAEIDIVAPSTNLDTALSTLVTLVGNLNYHTDFDAIAVAAGDEIDTVHPKTAYTTAIGLVQTLVTAMTYHTDYDAMVAAAVAEIDAVLLPASLITAKAAAYASDLDTAIDTATYARFQAGMRDIGAVMTSAFTIGAANIEAEKTRQVSKFTTDLNFQSYSERTDLIKTGVQQMLAMFIGKIEKQHGVALAELENAKDRSAILMASVGEMVKMLLDKVAKQGATADLQIKGQSSKMAEISQAIQTMSTMLTSKLEYNRVLAALILEQKRIKIVAKDEEEKRNAELDVLDAKWDLELFAYASNVLAGIAGGTSSTGNRDARSPLSNALGGALSGAAAGAMATGGNPVGIGVGALLGFGSSIL